MVDLVGVGTMARLLSRERSDYDFGFNLGFGYDFDYDFGSPRRLMMEAR